MTNFHHILYSIFRLYFIVYKNGEGNKIVDPLWTFLWGQGEHEKPFEVMDWLTIFMAYMAIIPLSCMFYALGKLFHIIIWMYSTKGHSRSPSPHSYSRS